MKEYDDSRILGVEYTKEGTSMLYCDYDKFDVKSSEYLSNVDVSVSLTALINRVSYMKVRLTYCMEIYYYQ